MPEAPRESLAIVTGTSTGIGEAVARQLLERGWEVIGVARRPAPLTQANYRHVAFDLAMAAEDPGQLEAAITTHIAGRSSHRVGLVNNAAAPEGLMPLANLDPRQVARVYAVNVVAPLWLMGFVVRTLPPDAALRIVNVSSGAATNGFPGLAAYGSSKAALRLAGMSLAQEWDTATPSKVLRDAAILSYEPGVVDTDMQRYARSRSPEEFPWVQMFLDFARRGIAVPPERPARDIVEFLESNHQPRFAERRLAT
jgi:NAD(P)-dependent dehydrogenase (short-subunit alcohol dehydrogenase family)